MSGTSSDEVQFSEEIFLESLNGMLSPDQEIRQTAEETIRELEIQDTDEFGIQLVDYVAHSEDPLEVCEVASAFLKHYIRTHWCSASEGFQPPEIDLESKAKIKKILPYGLWRSSYTVREAVADSILVITHSDWPENWPTLFDELITYCANNEHEAPIHGAMEFLIKFTKNLRDTQLPHASSVILQEMYKIFADKNKYSTYIRASAVKIFSQMVASVSTYKQSDLIQQYLEPSIPKFCAEFVQSDLKSDTELGCEILRAIKELTKTVPKCISAFLPKMLPLIWETLIKCAKDYQKIIGNIGGSIDDQGEVPEDSNDLLIAIFKFITVLMSGSDGCTTDFPEYHLLDYHWFHLQDSLPPEVLHSLIIFIGITNKQLEQWTNNPNQFVIEEKLITDESSYPQYSTRSEAQELLMKIVHRPERAAMNGLCDVILKQIEAGNAMRASCNSEVNLNWWKLTEASIQVFGLIKDIVAIKQQEGTLKFDVTAFLQNVVLVYLNNPESHPFLLGRCIYIGGLYSGQMPLEMRPSFIKATIDALKNHPTCARICAAKAANHWLHTAFANTNNHDTESILKPHLPALFLALFNLANQFMSADVLSIVLENFATLATLDKAFTASVENKICTLAIAAFVNFRSNCSILGICQQIFRELMLNPECVEPLQTHLVPTLVGKLTVNSSARLEDEESQVDTLEVLVLLVEHSTQPLSDFLIESAFPATCRFILSSDKYCTLLKGGTVISTYLSVAADQVIGYKNTDGKTGPQYISQVATHLLNFHHRHLLPKIACEIVISLIRKAGSTLGENVDQLLSAVFSGMQRVEHKGCFRRLLMVYAHFINTKFEAVLEFLSTVQGPNEQCALAFLISNGFCRQHKSFERDDRRTVTLALSKILEHSVTHQDSRLHQIQFYEAKGDAGSAIPLLVEISKLISIELSLDTYRSL